MYNARDGRTPKFGVCRLHIINTAVLPHQSFLFPRKYREHCPRPRGTTVQLVPIPTVSPWGLSPLPRSNRGYRGVTVIPITVQLSSVEAAAVTKSKLDEVQYICCGCCWIYYDRLAWICRIVLCFVQLNDFATGIWWHSMFYTMTWWNNVGMSHCPVFCTVTWRTVESWSLNDELRQLS